MKTLAAFLVAVLTLAIPEYANAARTKTVIKTANTRTTVIQRNGLFSRRNHQTIVAPNAVAIHANQRLRLNRVNTFACVNAVTNVNVAYANDVTTSFAYANDVTTRFAYGHATTCVQPALTQVVLVQPPTQLVDAGPQAPLNPPADPATTKPADQPAPPPAAPPTAVLVQPRVLLFAAAPTYYESSGCNSGLVASVSRGHVSVNIAPSFRNRVVIRTH